MSIKIGNLIIASKDELNRRIQLAVDIAVMDLAEAYEQARDISANLRAQLNRGANEPRELSMKKKSKKRK